MAAVRGRAGDGARPSRVLLAGALPAGSARRTPRARLVSRRRGCARGPAVRPAAQAPARGGGHEREAMRYLAELPLAPAAMAHNHELEWREVDGRAVEVATSVACPRLTVLLHFDDAGDVVAASCEDRPRAVGKSSIETPWVGEFSNYGVLGGVRVPTQADVRWDLPEWPLRLLSRARHRAHARLTRSAGFRGRVQCCPRIPSGKCRPTLAI